MLVVASVTAAVVAGRAIGRIGGADAQAMLLNSLGPHVVQMPIVQIVDVPVMLDGGVTAIRSVLVIVLGVMRRSHRETSSS
jgi:hypothetical protein